MNQRIAYEMLYLTIVGIVICLIVFIVVHFIIKIKKKSIENIKLEEASILSKKCFTAGKCYTVCTNYEPKEREELTLRVKDRIHIIEVYSDGRAYGKNVITEQTGIFPLSYLKNEVKNKRMKDLKVKKILIDVLSNFFLLLLFIFLLYFIPLYIMALIWIYNGYD
ncbi:hypothetical protein H8356DRAFT_1713265 [Neocallimastix lanati (nom. inval.)]|nr:hypothetical protein H8356DRAFT_1713265 [Neocallimastix sp. JGI-2020a]